MKVLLWGMGIFCFAFLLHVCIWQIRLPKGQTKAILRIFFSVLFAWLVCAYAFSSVSSWLTAYLPHSIAEYLHIIFFVSTLTLYYISFYTLIEADSPSLMIVLKVIHAGAGGLKKEELFSAFNDDMLVMARVNDLLEASMVSYENGRYKINPSGVVFIRPFIWLRKVLRCGTGG